MSATSGLAVESSPPETVVTERKRRCLVAAVSCSCVATTTMLKIYNSCNRFGRHCLLHCVAHMDVMSATIRISWSYLLSKSGAKAEFSANERSTFSTAFN
eukprot:scaffold2223_cov152-Skeletonema_marinoi.AAC.9